MSYFEDTGYGKCVYCGTHDANADGLCDGCFVRSML